MNRLPACALSLVLALCVAAGLAGCKPESEKAADALEPTLQSYLADKSGIKDADGLPAPDYVDSETASVLDAYGIDVDELHRHCFARYCYEVLESSVSDDGKTASVKVSITNVSLAGAAANAAADYAAFAQTEDAQQAYASDGHAALLKKLFELLYAHLDSDDLVTSEVTVSLTKGDDGAWGLAADGNDALYKALYGGSDVKGGFSSLV